MKQFSLIVSIICFGLALCLVLCVNVKMRVRVRESDLVLVWLFSSPVSEYVRVVSGYPILSGIIIA